MTSKAGINRVSFVAYLLAFLSSLVFSFSLFHVTLFRSEHPQTLWLLPLLIVLIWWDRRRPTDVLSSRDEVKALSLPVDGALRPPLRPTTWTSGLKQISFTLLAHGAGASVGREAVGLQIGGWAARLHRQQGMAFALCLATGFAVVLGTPWAASVFVFESMKSRPKLGDPTNLLRIVGLVGVTWLAAQAARYLGVSHPMELSFADTWSVLSGLSSLRIIFAMIAISILATVLSFGFLILVQRINEIFKSGLKGLVAAFSFLVLATVFFFAIGFSTVEAVGLSGLGTQVLPSLINFNNQLFGGLLSPIAVAVLKLALTAGFVGFGLRGGEMTPLLVCGSLVSVGVGVLMGLPTAALVAIGFSLIWGISARRPLTAAVLAGELFGFAPWGLISLIVFGVVSLGLIVGNSGERYFAASTKSLWRRGLYD